MNDTAAGFTQPDPETNQCSGYSLKRLQRIARRLRVELFRWIYEVTDPRYAPSCFATPVETRSPPAPHILRAGAQVVHEITRLIDDVIGTRGFNGSRWRIKKGLCGRGRTNLS